MRPFRLPKEDSLLTFTLSRWIDQFNQSMSLYVCVTMLTGQLMFASKCQTGKFAAPWPPKTPNQEIPLTSSVG